MIFKLLENGEELNRRCVKFIHPWLVDGDAHDVVIDVGLDFFKVLFICESTLLIVCELID